MATIDKLYKFQESSLDKLSQFEGLVPLFIRLLLAPVMIQAGWNKMVGFESMVYWFGHSLGLPAPELMAALAAGTEFFGGILLLVGLATRWVSIPLMVTMLVAMFSVHWDNGWLALSDASSWLANDRVQEAVVRKAKAIAILKQHGNYTWLTARGPITVLNNGIEFAATYFILLFSLFFTGGGKFTSLDYWLKRRVEKNILS